MATESTLLRRGLPWLAAVLLLILVLWQVYPWLNERFSHQAANPRPVTARGELAADELATIAIFERASPSVVFISTQQRVRNYWTRRTFNVPKGSGSGFIWDEFGHVVTNNHVIEEASEATIRLNDGRSYNAVLVGVSPSPRFGGGAH